MKVVVAKGGKKKTWEKGIGDMKVFNEVGRGGIGEVSKKRVMREQREERGM